MLPKPILNRKKMGFEVPVGEFLRNELREMFHDTVTPKAMREFGLNPAAAEQLYEDHCRRRGDHTEILWALLVLCHWRGQS